MTQLKAYERQYPLSAIADLGIANLGAGNEVTIPVPPNALVLEVVVLGTTAFDSGTTATVTATDGTTVYANAVDVKSTGAKTVANVPKFYPTGGTITCSAAQTGTAGTVGRALVMVRYVTLNRANEEQF